MKKLKKAAILIVSLLLAATPLNLFGCGSDTDSATDLKINYWQSGYGIEFMNKAIEGFKAKYPQYNVDLYASPTATSVMAGFGQGADHDPVDLYVSGSINANLIQYAEPLNDLINEKADDSENKTIKEKYFPDVIESFKMLDGNYYNLAFSGSMGGIVYNNTVINGTDYTIPRTTEELDELCGELVTAGKKPFIHWNEGYWFLFYPVLQAQYDGMDYYKNTFLTLGNQDLSSQAAQDTAKSILTKQDGRYKAMEALENIITDKNVVTGSNSFDFSSAQTKFLNGDAVMMVNGGWLLNEMNKSEEVKAKFSMMKTPIISSIIDHCDSVADDLELRALIDAIDAAIDSGKGAADIELSGTGYEAVREDIKTVYNARRIMMSLYNDSVFTIPNYSNAKQAAKDFIKYFYSDENIKNFSGITHIQMPVNLSTGENLNTTGWCGFELEQIEFVKKMEPIYLFNTMPMTNKLFTLGTARPFPYTNSGYDFPNLFAKTDGKTALQIWGDMITVFNTNWQTYLRTAGFID